MYTIARYSILRRRSGQVIRSWPHFAQSHTSGNRSNRAILLFGALLMGVLLPKTRDQDDRCEFQAEESRNQITDIRNQKLEIRN